MVNGGRGGPGGLCPAPHTGAGQEGAPEPGLRVLPSRRK